MTDIVKGMARAYHEAYWNWTPTLPRSMEDEAMRAALQWLADNVSDEMVQAYRETLDRHPRDPWLPSIAESKALAAAIRAAGDGK